MLLLLLVVSTLIATTTGIEKRSLQPTFVSVSRDRRKLLVNQQEEQKQQQISLAVDLESKLDRNEVSSSVDLEQDFETNSNVDDDFRVDGVVVFDKNKDSNNNNKGDKMRINLNNASVGEIEPVEMKQPKAQEFGIVLQPPYGPTSGGVWVQVIGAGSFYTPNSLQCKMDLVEQFCYSNHYYYTWCYLTPKCSGVYKFNCHNGPMQFHGKYAVVSKIPTVTSVYPFTGDIRGGTAITVRGLHFEAHCPKQLLCKFGSQVVKAKFYTPTSVMCVSPCASQRSFVSVEVSNDGGQHWSISGVQFSYVGDELEPEDTAMCQRYIAKEAMQEELERQLEKEEQTSTALESSP